MKNTPPRRAAATGRETGKVDVEGEVKRSMIRPSVKGTERETADETVSYSIKEILHQQFLKVMQEENIRDPRLYLVSSSHLSPG